MTAVLALVICGCATLVYRPTQADKMPYPEAAKRILGQRGNKLMVRPNFYTIADVKLGPASVDFTYFKHAAFGKDSAETATLSVPIASLGEISVLEKAAQYSVMSGEQALLVLFSRDGACATADALLALKSRAANPRPAEGQAASESVEARPAPGAAPGPETVPSQPGAVPDGAPIFTGRVESVDGIILPRAGGGRGARVKMNVISDSGGRSLCIVLADAAIHDADGTDISARQLKGKRIEMRYIDDTIRGWFGVPQAVMAATAIRVLEP